jgi:hypothetical protein
MSGWVDGAGVAEVGRGKRAGRRTALHWLQFCSPKSGRRGANRACCFTFHNNMEWMTASWTALSTISQSSLVAPFLLSDVRCIQLCHSLQSLASLCFSPRVDNRPHSMCSHSTCCHVAAAAEMKSERNPEHTAYSLTSRSRALTRLLPRSNRRQ